MSDTIRPYRLRDFTDSDKVEKDIRMSPEAQQEVVRFLLSFEAICRKYDEKEALMALELLREDFLKNYPDFLKSQPILDEQLKIIWYEPDSKLVKVLNGRRTINVPEKLLEKNPEIKQAGLELLLCFWNIYEDKQEEIRKALQTVISHYIRRYPESIDSIQNGIEDVGRTNQKLGILSEILETYEGY
ncbi:hypothetical protein A3F64_00940 [Candidatus Saccharibacteria bacterium RIFCSPHIGHO2_12_FULL_42_8]|nr:MAG: hypothetical protein A3F64_00940 [Candidatus Saccharibacteria bacterium RIFCSPHIGHO2_12_FULL_42_8]